MRADGAQYLLTGRLNQDPIENEFSVARQKCGFERNPSVRLFRQNLKHRIQAALVQPPAGANCEPDEDELLSAVTAESAEVDQHASCSSGSQEAATLSSPSEELGELLTTDLDTDEDIDSELGSTLPSLESCSVRYFTGYGVGSSLKKFKCNDCRRDLLKLPSLDAADCTEEALIRNKEYRDDKSSLLYPTDETTQAVDVVLSILDRFLKEKIHVAGFKKHVILKSKQRLFKNHPDWLRCGTECYRHREFILNKIVSAKLKRTLQSMLKELRQPGRKYGGHWEKLVKLKNN